MLITKYPNFFKQSYIFGVLEEMMRSQWNNHVEMSETRNHIRNKDGARRSGSPISFTPLLFIRHVNKIVPWSDCLGTGPLVHQRQHVFVSFLITLPVSLKLVCQNKAFSTLRKDSSCLTVMTFLWSSVSFQLYIPTCPQQHDKYWGK